MYFYCPLSARTRQYLYSEYLYFYHVKVFLLNQIDMFYIPAAAERLDQISRRSFYLLKAAHEAPSWTTKQQS